MEAASHRRWLIGLAISVFFGLFGAVMAVLAYTDRTRTPAPTAGPKVTAAAPPAPVADPHPGKDHKKK